MTVTSNPWGLPVTTGQAEDIFSILSDKRIQLCEPEQVIDYLTIHPALFQALPHICQIIRSRFPAPTQILLELYVDPEIDDQYLTFTVQPKVLKTDFLQRLRITSEECLRLLENSSDWLLITTHFDVLEVLNS